MVFENVYASSKRVIGVNRGVFISEDEKGKSKTDAEHVESDDYIEKQGAKQSVCHRAKRHFRRFWCCYLIGGIIFLAIFLPILFLVIIPAIAQRIVNDMDVPVYSAEILDPKPDRFTFSLRTAVDIPAGISARTDPLTLQLFDRAVKPMQSCLSMGLQSYTLKGHAKVEVTKPDTIVENEDEWVKVLSKAVSSSRFALSVKGSTTAHLGALKAGITLDKDVELDGLDNLSGFTITSARLKPVEKDGSNLRGEVMLPNHSVFTLELGNVTLNLKSKDLVIGYADLQDLTLKPGNNTVPLRGRLDIRTVLRNLPDVLAAQKDAIQNGEIELTASGNQTVYKGQHIPYLERVLNDLRLTTRVPIMTVLRDTLDGLKGNGSIFDRIGELNFAGILKDL